MTLESQIYALGILLLVCIFALGTVVGFALGWDRRGRKEP